MNKIWKPALLSLAVIIMAIGMINSGAWWTDSAATQTQSIKSGTLSLKDAGFTSFNLGMIDNMAPGDFTNEVSVIIENDGTIPLAWFGDLVISDSVLKDVIFIDYARMEFLKPGGVDTWITADEFIKDGDYQYAGMQGTGGLVSLDVWDGNSDMAPGTKYEHMGALKPGYMYKLTLRFGFYEDAGNEYQGKGPLNLSFAVDSTQINATAMESLGATLGNHYEWMMKQIALQVP